MRAYKVFEMEFERNQDPKLSMGMGIESFLMNYKDLYDKTESENIDELEDKLDSVLLSLPITPIELDRGRLPWQIVTSESYSDWAMGNTRMYDLPFGLTFIKSMYGEYSYIVDKKGKAILSDSEDSMGKYAVEKLSSSV